MKKIIWNIESTTNEEYPHVILKPYVDALLNQTEGKLKPEIQNRIVNSGFKTEFFVNVGRQLTNHSRRFLLFQVESLSHSSIYPARIVLANSDEAYGNGISVTDSESFKSAIDEFIKSEKVGTKLAYLLKIHSMYENSEIAS